jgi:hypothetical protein
MGKNDDIRAVLLDVIERYQPRDRTTNMQSATILREASIAAGIRGNHAMEQALLTQFHELFRTGYLAWGYNLSNPDPPFFHLTEQGLKTLAELGGDPGNPKGYLARVDAVAHVNAIARSYLEEAVYCYIADHYKASAVMAGAAAESIVLELRDAVETKLKQLQKAVPKDLTDWRIARVLQALRTIFNGCALPSDLKATYEAYWSAFTQQIRAVRNDAVHPSSVDPITPDAVHASLLIFPELLRLAHALRAWVINNMS